MKPNKIELSAEELATVTGGGGGDVLAGGGGTAAAAALGLAATGVGAPVAVVALGVIGMLAFIEGMYLA